MRVDERQAAMAYAAGRVAIGLGIALLPGPLLAGLVGHDAGRASVRYLGRLMGVRDVLIGAGALAALATRQPAGPWLAAGAAADASDALATLVSWPHLTRGGRALAGPFAVAGAAAGWWLAARAGESPVR